MCWFNTKNNKSRQAGFTLVELMVSIVLGLLLVAAAVQLFMSGQIAYKVQQAGATVQDSGIFGFSYITQSIRIANYGNIGAMNDETLFGGIILSGAVASTTPARDGNLKGLKVGSTVISGDSYLTTNALQDSAYGVKSDQLVIMYQAPRDMQNCKGENVTGPVRTVTTYTPGQYVIERYYIKNTGTLAAPDAALYCDAAIFTDNENTRKNTGIAINDYGSGGVMLINHTDMMRIQLITRTTSGTQTMPINTYRSLSIQDKDDTTTPKKLKTSRPAIIGINLGLLIRSTEKAGSPDSAKTYSVLDKSVTAPNDGYLRKAYITTIALRNGGINGEVIVND